MAARVAQRPPWLTRDGGVAALIAAHDWSGTPLGAIDGWPAGLVTLVQLTLALDEPACLLAGAPGTLLYNDRCAALFGAAHPAALGAPFGAVFAGPGPAALHAAALDGRGGSLGALVPAGAAAALRLDATPARDALGAVCAVFCRVGRACESAAAADGIAAGQALLLQLSDALRGEADPLRAQAAAMRLLADHLGAEVAFCFDAVHAGGGWTPRVEVEFRRQPRLGVQDGDPAAAAVGPDGLERFTALAEWAALQQGHAARIGDLQRHPAFAASAAGSAPQPGAFAAVPVLAGGQLLGGVCVQQAVPRDWSDAELALMRDVAERTWDALQRARAALALQADINERKRAEQDRQRFATLVEQSSDFIGFASLDGRGEYLNRAGAALLGLEHPDGVRATTIADHLMPDEALRFAETVIPQVLSRGLWHGEVRFRHQRSGEPIPMEQSIFLLRDLRSGQPLHIATVARDQRERQLAQQRLQRSEAEYRWLFEQSALGLAELELPGGRFLRVNAHYCRMLGYSAAELLRGMTVADVTHADDRDAADALLRDAERGFETELRYRRQGGATRWVQLFGAPVRDAGGQVTRLLVSAVDITARREAEQRIAADERRFQLAAEAVSGFIYEYGVADETVSASHGIEQLLGLPASAFSRLQDWNERIEPQDLQHVREVALAAWRSGGRSYQTEYRVHHAGGRLLTVWDHAVVERDAGGRVARVFGHVIDITQRQQAEQQLREADRRKDEFLATLAHELRNPLAPIRNGLQIMALPGADAAAVDAARAMMQRQLEQMARLIDELMDVSRISRGLIVLDTRRMALADAVRDAVDAALPQLEAAGHRFVLELPDEPLEVIGDRLRLAQVFANLLNNAAKYTRRGGRVRLALQRQGDDAVVSVEDNGIGIPPALLTRVFDMFAQLDRSLEKTHGGLGLGLNIALRLTERHGGTISADSAGADRGSRFTVRLPALPPRAAPVLPRPPAVAAAAATLRRRVLVVDDNIDAAASLALMLTLVGHDTLTAHDGIEALEAAQRFRPQVVLMDIGMPRLNGFDACRRLREAPWGAAMTVIAQSGWGQHDDKRRADAAGFDAHLTKPIDPAALLKMIDALPPPAPDAAATA